MYLLDASAFIHEYHTTEPTASVPQVKAELTDEAAYRFDAMEGSGMHLQLPDPGTVERVERAAETSGDLEVLSTTDLHLLAATLELSGTVVTDDYAVQNVAEKLDLDVEVIAREGIDEVRDWRYQCQGCGQEFEEHEDRCPICGADLARKNPS